MIKKALGILLSAMLIITSISAAAVSVSAAEGDPTFIVAGSNAEVFGAEWSPSLEDNLMTQKADGTYEKVYTGVAPQTELMLKVVEHPADGSAAIWHGDSTGNNLTFNVESTCDITVNYNPTTQEVTVTGSGVNFEIHPSFDHIYAVGGGSADVPSFLHGIAWDPAAPENEMTEVSDGIYEITFEGVPENMGYEIKFAAGSWTNNWGGSFVGTGIETAADYNGANIVFDVEEDDSTVVARLDLSEFDYNAKTGAKFTITINDEVMSTDPVEDANLKFKNYSLSLASNIEMNFNVNASVLEGFTDPYVVVNCAGEETTLTDYTTSNGVYTFKFNKIYPQLMGENVTAVLHAKQGIVDHYSAPYTRSVKGYCNNMLKYDHNTFAKFHTLLINLLNYGAQAQTYIGYKTNELANKDLTAEQQSWALTDVGTLNNVRNYKAEEIDNPTVTFSSASLSLGSTVGVSIQFTTPDVENTKIVATVRGTSYEFTSEDFVAGSSGKQKLVFNNLLANDMRETVSFKAYVNDELASNTATYSIESYVSNHTNDGNNLANLLNAMYLYGEAAKAYAG